MKTPVFYAPVRTGSLGYAIDFLKDSGVAFAGVIDRSVTHVLLGVPAVAFENIAETLSRDAILIGGKLPSTGFPSIDLLKDPDFLAENADITARCAISLAAGKLPVTWKGLPVAVIGWGRIGKCLASLLKAQAAAVTVIARKPETRAMVRALGYEAADTDRDLQEFSVVFNTADNAGIQAPEESLSIDLASRQGLMGDKVLWARGLPGKLAPKSAGRLIAETVLRLLKL